MEFYTSHLGRFALTWPLIEHILRTRDARVVTVSSSSYGKDRLRGTERGEIL
jgi:hypothetical protein